MAAPWCLWMLVQNTLHPTIVSFPQIVDIISLQHRTSRFTMPASGPLIVLAHDLKSQNTFRFSNTYTREISWQMGKYVEDWHVWLLNIQDLTFVSNTMLLIALNMCLCLAAPVAFSHIPGVGLALSKQDMSNEIDYWVSEDGILH